ncbi:MAG: CoA activase [Desulfobacterota bacterium]|nr:CoA activase [Thermodesulfobacteriota bacterium]
MEAETRQTFRSLTENVGAFRLKDKTFLIPQMNRIGGLILAGAFRSFGVHAVLMDTYEGLDLGKAFTSGKECFPCQVTTGDILLFLKKEKERLGKDFDPDRYIYFMPEAQGPCRFGMYNKYQRIVLDSFPELEKLKIGSLTSKNSYALDGMFDAEQTREFRKVGYLSVVVSDVLDRLLWRVRPYERQKGAADAFIESSSHRMAEAFERHGAKKDFDRILDELSHMIREGKRLIDTAVPRKPLIGIVGEIYLRTHVQANQDVIRLLEKHGAEVVNASIAEWVNYTTYDRMREAKISLRLSLKQLQVSRIMDSLKKIVSYGADLSYQHYRQDQVYKRVKPLLDLAQDHRIQHMDEILGREKIYSFDVGTEACLSIPGILEYVRQGCNGVVNVYPFTCMPSTITSSIIRPIMNEKKVPYLDTPYDGSFQPGREAAIRTFMYQAQQHFKRHGRNGSS